MSNEKKYPLTITPLFKSGFRQQSLVITNEIMEALAQVQPGGKLVVRELKAESRSSDKSPVGYLEYLTPGDVADLKAKYAARNNDSTESI